MDAAEIRREKEALEAKWGPWTAHNIRLANDLYTLSSKPTGDEVKLRRVTQIVGDLFGGDFSSLRILDLACLEGMYALDFASRGASVVAIEGREGNLEKARFAAHALGIDGVEFELGDVRLVSKARHGEFDAVLCLGILYHLDAADLLGFVSQLGEVCKRLLVVDTAVSLRGPEELSLEGYGYRGETLIEHTPESTEEERRNAVWSSLDNLNAFALTQPSLFRVLARAGFTTVYDCGVPAEPAKVIDRVTVAALKGVPVSPIIGPEPDDAATDVPERAPLGARLPQTRTWAYGRAFLPPRLRRRVRRFLGSETRRH